MLWLQILVPIGIIVGTVGVVSLSHYRTWWPDQPLSLNCYQQIDADAGQLTVIVEKGIDTTPCFSAQGSLGYVSMMLYPEGSPKDIAQDSCIAVKRRTLVLELKQAGQENTARYLYNGKRVRGGPVGTVALAGLSPPMLEARLAAEKDSLYCRWRKGREDDCRQAEIADSTRRALEAMGGPYQPCPQENCR